MTEEAISTQHKKVTTGIYVHKAFNPFDMDANFLKDIHKTTVQDLINSDYSDVYISISVDSSGNIFCGMRMSWKQAPKRWKVDEYSTRIVYDGQWKAVPEILYALKALKFYGKNVNFCIYDVPPQDSWASIFVNGTDEYLKNYDPESSTNEHSPKKLNNVYTSFKVLKETLTIQFPTEQELEDLRKDFGGKLDQQFIQDNRGKEVTLVDCIDFGNDNMIGRYFYTNRGQIPLIEAFARMLEKIGYKHVSFFASCHPEWWIWCLKTLHRDFPGFVKAINLRCHGYGGISDPAAWIEKIKQMIPDFHVNLEQTKIDLAFNAKINTEIIATQDPDKKAELTNKLKDIPKFDATGFLVPNVMASNDGYKDTETHKFMEPPEVFFAYMTFMNDSKSEDFTKYITGGSIFIYHYIKNCDFTLNEYCDAIIDGIDAAAPKL